MKKCVCVCGWGVKSLYPTSSPLHMLIDGFRIPIHDQLITKTHLLLYLGAPIITYKPKLTVTKYSINLNMYKWSSISIQLKLSSPNICLPFLKVSRLWFALEISCIVFVLFQILLISWWFYIYMLCWLFWNWAMNECKTLALNLAIRSNGNNRKLITCSCPNSLVKILKGCLCVFNGPWVFKCNALDLR